MKLKPKEIKREKSKRPPETKHISLERIARGTVTASSEVLFQVELSKKRYYLFRKDDSSDYNQPKINTSIRCIYYGDKNNLFPHSIYDMNWNLLWREK
jgi:hypothetical protein